MKVNVCKPFVSKKGYNWCVETVYGDLSKQVSEANRSSLQRYLPCNVQDATNIRKKICCGFYDDLMR